MKTLEKVKNYISTTPKEIFDKHWKKVEDIGIESEVTIDWSELLESRTWLTAQRIRIPISEMRTSHIKNTIRCLKGESITRIPNGWNGKSHARWIDLMEEKLKRR